jgi:RNA polymerase sigma factor (sigma-70 family)
VENNSSDDRVTVAGGSATEVTGVPALPPPRSRVDRAREQEVLEHVRKGRREVALKILMVVYGDLLAGFLARLVTDRDHMRDIYRDVFLQVVYGVRKLEGGDNSSLWSRLCRITYQRILDEQRSQYRAGSADTSPDLDVLERLLGAPDSMVEDDRDAAREVLERCLAEIPALLRARLMMRYYLGLSQAELAEAEGVAPGAAPRAHAQVEELLGELPAFPVFDSWHDEVLSAASRLERRRALKRWAWRGGAVAVVAVAVVVVAMAWPRPEPKPELEVVIRHTITTRGDAQQASVGDRLVVVARSGSPGDLRVYRGERDVLVARCPRGPDCTTLPGSSGEQTIEITLDVPAHYEVIFVVGAWGELPETSLDAYLDAARAANARIETRSIIVR